MPFGDGTGPQGMGAMTGRGAGYCTGVRQPGFFSRLFGRGGFGSFGGFGRGAGHGRGRGFAGRGYNRFTPYSRW